MWQRKVGRRWKAQCAQPSAGAATSAAKRTQSASKARITSLPHAAQPRLVPRRTGSCGPDRTAPHRIAPHRIAPHRLVPLRARSSCRTALHRVVSRRIASHPTAPRRTAPHRGSKERRNAACGCALVRAWQTIFDQGKLAGAAVQSPPADRSQQIPYNLTYSLPYNLPYNLPPRTGLSRSHHDLCIERLSRNLSRNPSRDYRETYRETYGEAVPASASEPRVGAQKHRPTTHEVSIGPIERSR